MKVSQEKTTSLPKEDKHYQLITEFYGSQKAERSGVPYIQHIHEGLVVLDEIGATKAAKQAYCLHPIFQGGDSLSQSERYVGSIEPWVLVLAMEYRNIANAYLSKRKIKTLSDITLSPLVEVNDMLIADKVQNRKDFEIYHLGKHDRSNELAHYFRNWLTRLGISEERYKILVARIVELFAGV